MQKAKKKVIGFIFIVSFLLLAFGCLGKRKVYEISGNVEQLKQINDFKIEKGIIKVKEGTKITLELDPDKFDTDKLFESATYTEASNTPKELKLNEQASLIVRSNIRVDIKYKEYEYVEVIYKNNKYDNILKFTEIPDPKITAPAIKTVEDKKFLRVGAKLKYIPNQDSHFLLRNTIETVELQNVFISENTEFTVQKLPFTINVNAKDNNKGIHFPDTLITSLKNDYNIILKSTELGDYKFYPRMNLTFDISNFQLKNDNSKELKSIKIGKEKFEITEELKEVTYKFGGKEEEFNVEVVIKDAKDYSLEVKNPANFEILVNKKAYIPGQKIYKKDIVTLKYIAFDRSRRLTSVLLNDNETMGREDVLKQEYKHEFTIDGKSDKYIVEDTLKNLEPITFQFDQNTIYLYNKNKKIDTSPYIAYAYEEIKIYVDSTKIGEHLVRGIILNTKQVSNSDNFILQLDEQSSKNYTIDFLKDDKNKFYELECIFENPAIKDEILVNSSQITTYYHKQYSKELIFSFKTGNSIFLNYYLDGEKKDLEEDSETFKIIVENKDKVKLEFKNLSIRKKEQKVEIIVPDSIKDYVNLGKYHVGLQNVKVEEDIIIKAVNTQNIHSSFTKHYMVNGTMLNISLLDELVIKVKEVDGIFKIELLEDSIYIRDYLDIKILNKEDLKDIFGIKIINPNTGEKKIDFDALENIFIGRDEDIKIFALGDYYVYKVKNNGLIVELDSPCKEYIFKKGEKHSLEFYENLFVREEKMDNIECRTVDSFSYKKLGLSKHFKVYSKDLKDTIFTNNGNLYFAKDFANKKVALWDETKVIFVNISVSVEIESIEIESPNTDFISSLTTYRIGAKNIYNPITKVKYQAYNPDTKLIESKEYKEIENAPNFKLDVEIKADNDTRLLHEGSDYTLVAGYKFDFSKYSDSIGKCSISIKFKDFSKKFDECEIIKNGYNVYTQEEIEIYFANPDVEYILLHRPLKLKYRDNQLHPNKQFTNEFLLNLSNDTHYDYIKKHIGEPMLSDKINGSYFIRNTQKAKDLCFDGNGFELNAVETPHTLFKKTTYLPSAVAEPGSGVFALDTDEDFVSAITTIRNVKLFGNSALPGAGLTFDESNVPAWASSGMHGVYAPGTHVNVDNVIVDNFVIGIFARRAQLSVLNSKVRNCWGSGIFFAGISGNKMEYNYDDLKEIDYINHLWLENNEMGPFGGPAITLLDHLRAKRGDGFLNKDGGANDDILESKRYEMKISDDPLFDFENELRYAKKFSKKDKRYHSFSFDPLIVLKNNTIKNYIDGTSSYYTALNLSVASSIIAGLNPVFKLLNQQGIEKSHINNDKRVNFAFLLQNGSIFEAANNTPTQHDIPRHDLRYLSTNSGRRYYEDKYFDNHPVLSQIREKANGLVIGSGYDVAKFFNKAAEKGADLGNADLVKQLFGLALVYSLTGNALDPEAPLKDAGSANDFSKKYLELSLPKLGATAVPASFIFELFDQNLPA